MTAPPQDRSEERRGLGCPVFVGATGLWLYLLYDFVEPLPWVLLALLGAVLTLGGLYLVVGGLRHSLEGLQYFGLSLLGLLMVAGGLATLAPAAPAELLARTATGWRLLESRSQRLSKAITDGDLRLAGKLARRGVGDSQAVDLHGLPLLHLAESSAMVETLLTSGLDPDVRGEAGRTLLMKERDLETARLLLAAGADPNARDENGATVLMRRGDEGAELIGLLLEAGADVHAVDASGRTVADLVRGPGRPLLERYADGPLEESGGVLLRGREEWLTAAAPTSTVLGLDPSPLAPGEVGTVTIRVANPAPQDRLLEVSAVLDNALFFVGADHGGVVDDRARPGPTSTVRWPKLALPAGREGLLEMQVLARSDDAVADLPVGDLSLDVRVLDLPQRTEQVLTHYQERSAPPPRVAVTSASGLAVFLLPLVAVAALGLLWLVLRGRATRQGATAQQSRLLFGRLVFVGSALLCLAIAAVLAWSMLEPRLRFEETTCEVLDHRALGRTLRSTTTRSGGSAGRRTTVLVPVAAVRIATAEGPLVAAGFATGAANRSVQELRALPIGTTARCWIDPSQPRRFTLVKSPSLSGIVGVVMLLGLAAALFVVAALLGRWARQRVD